MAITATSVETADAGKVGAYCSVVGEVALAKEGTDSCSGVVETKGSGYGEGDLPYGVPGLRMCEKAGICPGLDLLCRSWK